MATKEHHKACDCVQCNRSDQFFKDQLARYTDKLFYDCTLSVGTLNPKVIKGHKMILASASDAFAKLLYTSDLTEGKKGKDDPITIEDDISPEALDYVLRFIYGEVGEISNIPIACEVYKFAHKWLIEDLMDVAAKKLDTAKSDEIHPVCETSKHD